MRIRSRLGVRSHRWAMLAAISILAVGTALAEEVIVGVQTLVIRAGKGSMFPPVAEVKNQDTLTVIERQPDKWLKVKVGDKEGFVRETALVARSNSGLGGVVAGASALSGNTSDVGASAAARGLDHDAVAYASTKGFDTSPLSQMIQNRDRVVGQTWLAFTQQGKVGPAKQ